MEATMDSPIVVEWGMLIIACYSFSLLGTYCGIRRYCASVPLSLCLSIPGAQAIHSFILQVSLLAGIEALFWVGEVTFLGLAAYHVYRSAEFSNDLKISFHHAGKHLFLSLPLLVWLIYGFFQVLLMPIKNIDALVYHLPRVALFGQEQSFFPATFNLYHQVIFPVGADILFYPFWRLGTTSGMGIFSLTSYLSLGAGAYAISRHFTDQKRAAVSALILLGLTLPILQSVTVKNDIIMAASGIACLALLVRREAINLPISLCLFGVLAAFGISAKSLFLAFLPGLGVLLIVRYRLFSREVVARVFSAWRNVPTLVLGCLLMVVVLSNAWLFAWNHLHYGSWSGPEDFAYRHQQHDGWKGTAANVMRYTFQVPQFGIITDNLVAPMLGLKRPSVVVRDYYDDFVEPVFGSAGASREAFAIYWAQHEDYAWFGPMGAFVIFICLLVTLIRKPRMALMLLPAIGYFLIVAAQISWMPWNGRFFTIFVFALSPAVAITLGEMHSRFLVSGLIAVSILSGTIAKLFDTSRPAIPLIREIRSGGAQSISATLWQAATRQSNAWNDDERHIDLHEGTPTKLLEAVPGNATVGIYTEGRQSTYGYFMARPDVEWIPLNYASPDRKISREEAVRYLLRNETGMAYLLIVGIGDSRLGGLPSKYSADMHSVLLKRPVHPAR